ncbi:MAG TPA: HNH endonuclease [Mycobacteriales bacterium]|nr:HNH endonuclease [Mycobacteriales bacterium]
MAASGSAALVLNATYEPLCVVPGQRAVVLVLTAKAVPVADGDGVLHAATCSVPVPSVLRLTRFVRVPYRATVPLTRKAVFARDGGRCVYCGAAATSLDHVVPRSRGGEHAWENVVSACSRCNHVKADRAVADLGWRLRRPPSAPTGAAWRIVGARRIDPRWWPYLEGLPGRPEHDVEAETELTA